MKLSEIKPEEYEIIEQQEGDSSLVEKVGTLGKGVASFGARLGGAVVQSGLGLSELALRAAERATGIKSIEKVAGEAKKLREDVFGERLKKQFGGGAGTAGEFAGMGATFLAPTKQILSAQKITSALGKEFLGGGRIARGATMLGRAGIEGVSDFGIELARTGGDVKSATKALKIGFGASAGLQTLGGIARATFWPELASSATRALGVQGKTTGGRVLPQVEKKVAGLGVLKKYASEVTIKDADGFEKTFEPSKSTFHEVLQAWNKVRQDVYDKYSIISKQAGETVDVDISEVGKGLSNIINGARTGTYKNAAKNILDDIVNTFGQVDDTGKFIGFKRISPKELELYLSDLYNEASAAIAGRSDKAHGEIAAATASNLRKYLDDVIEQAAGLEYQQLRGEYSALKSIEQDLVRRFQQEARQLGGGLSDYVNIFSSGDIIGGMLFNQPQQIAKGVTQGWLGNLLKNLKRPDRYMRRAFNLIDEKSVGDVSRRMFGGSGQLTPDEQRIFESARDYIRNPNSN